MILIDFPGGAHGNYLEYMCNRFIGGVKTNSSPFKSIGVSHAKEYYSDLVFECEHWSLVWPERLAGDEKIVSIDFQLRHMMQLVAIAFLRAGELNVDVRGKDIEDNLFKRLFPTGPGNVDLLLKEYIDDLYSLGYNDIRDPSWPVCNTVDDYIALPQTIKDELAEVHNFRFWQVDAEQLHCPQWIIREQFYIMFMDPHHPGSFWQHQLTQRQASSNASSVLSIDLMSLYDMDGFIDSMQRIAEFTEYEFKPSIEFREIHQTFLGYQPFKNSYSFCSTLVTDIINDKIDQLPELDILQEGFICAKLCEHYGTVVNLAEVRDWFNTATEIRKFVTEAA